MWNKNNELSEQDAGWLIKILLLIMLVGSLVSVTVRTTAQSLVYIVNYCALYGIILHVDATLRRSR